MKPAQRKRAVIVGIFILLGIMFLFGGLFMIGGKRNSFEKTIRLNVIFDNVSGLQNGNNIWCAGVKIGIVKKVRLISNHKVQVLMEIDKEYQDLIYKDTRAKIGSDGLVGNKIVMIYGGSQDMSTVKSGDTLFSENIHDKEQMMNTLDESTKNLLDITKDFKTVSKRMADGQGTLGRLFTEDSLMNMLKLTAERLQSGSLHIQMLASDISGYTAKLHAKGALANDLVTDTSLFSKLRIAAVQIEEASENAKELTNNLKIVSYNLKDSSNLAGIVFHDTQTAKNLRVTVENLREGTKKFDDNMLALQHNFLFRGFFRKRAKQEQQQREQEQKKIVVNKGN
jgi:phospholipid/cholesterol/gamma-HCH transport system substrate-binding protein